MNTRGRTLIDLWLVSERLSAKLDHALGSVHGIAFVEFMVLYQLAQSPTRQMRRVDLAQAIGRTASGVTRLLRPMEKTGLVGREDAARDARVSLVTLTAAGEERLKDASTTVGSLALRFTQAVGDTQVDSLAAALGLLRD